MQHFKELYYHFLFCFVLKTIGAADCPKPEPKDAFRLTDDSIVKSKFPEGSTVTYKCITGYEVEQGSATVTCTDGKWSDLELTCRKKDCGFLSKRAHIRYDYISGGTSFGAKVKPVCDKGFELFGSSYMQCFDFGWSGNSRCEVVTCQNPTEIPNGKISKRPESQFPEYGNVIQYTCDVGFALFGNDTLVCTAEGEYDSPPPNCTGPQLQVLSGPHSFAVVLGSVTGIVLVALIVLSLLYCFLKKKGSYETREDLWQKEDHLHFHNY